MRGSLLTDFGHDDYVLSRSTMQSCQPCIDTTSIRTYSRSSQLCHLHYCGIYTIRTHIITGRNYSNDTTPARYPQKTRKKRYGRINIVKYNKISNIIKYNQQYILSGTCSDSSEPVPDLKFVLKICYNYSTSFKFAINCAEQIWVILRLVLYR